MMKHFMYSSSILKPSILLPRMITLSSSSGRLMRIRTSLSIFQYFRRVDPDLRPRVLFLALWLFLFCRLEVPRELGGLSGASSMSYIVGPSESVKPSLSLARLDLRFLELRYLLRALANRLVGLRLGAGRPRALTLRADLYRLEVEVGILIVSCRLIARRRAALLRSSLSLFRLGMK